MIVLAVLLTAGVFVGIVAIVVRMSRRRLPGEFEAPPPVRRVHPERPPASSPVGSPGSSPGTSPGTSSGGGGPVEAARPQPEPVDSDDFAQWEAEHWPRSEQ
jgi:hypothetical protein